MDKRILYPNGNGGVVVVIPVETKEDDILTIAKKSVPSGTPFKIADASDVPQDRLFRQAWTIDPLTCTDGVGEK